VTAAVWLILIFLLLVVAGIPIAFCFGIASVFFLYTVMPGTNAVIISRSFGALDSFPLLAIPFFILAGDLMKEGGISRHLINFVNIFVGKIRGGLAHVTVLASTFFGAISGSSAATVAAIGGIMIPEMVRRGYDRNYAVVVSAASGFIGILIPPSIPLIVYGMNAEVSVAKLFLGGIVPGLLMALGFMVVNHFMTPGYSSSSRDSNASNTDAVLAGGGKTAVRAIPALVMPLIILGGIYSGVFTPTEAGAVAVVYGILVSVFYYQSMGLAKLLNISSASALTSSVILIIISLAGVLGWIITIQRVPALITEFVISMTQNPIVVLMMLNVFYLVLGTFMETVTAIVITTPIFLPLIQALGIDPVHFGIIQTTNLCVGLITPPMALNLLMASKTGGISVGQAIKPLLPYFITAIVVLLLVTYIPALSLFLPDMLMD